MDPDDNAEFDTSLGLTLPALAPSGPVSAVGATWAESSLVAGRYEILGFLGAGGMGSVYKARDRELDEVVALKVLRRELLTEPGALERFKLEVKLARRVTSRAVARTFDIGEHEGEKLLTMEFVDGASLGRALATREPLEAARVVALGQRIAEGLAAAHAAGVVHRDLKPDNVMLARDGRVVITDFGIAQLVDATQARAGTLTAVGTPAYMAPEQVRADPDVDGRADLFALGVILFECLTGELPFKGKTAFALAAARLLVAAPDVRDVRPGAPTGLAELVARLLAREPSDRLASADEVRAALDSMAVELGPGRSKDSSRGPASVVTDGRGAKRIAVLPFRNLGDAGDAELATGLADELVDALSMLDGVRVCARAVVEQACARGARGAHVPHDPRELGRELGVQVVVDGSFRRLGDGVRVVARLVSVTDGFQVWARRFDATTGSLLAVVDDAAQAIAAALTVGTRPAPERQMPDGLAVEAYLRARAEYHRFGSAAAEAAVGLFQHASGLAPADPSVTAGYALALARRFFYSGHGGDEALAVAMRARDVAPASADSQLALGVVYLQTGHNELAARHAARARALAPSNAEVRAFLGRMLGDTGPARVAIAELEAAIRLDPTIAMTHRDAARALAVVGEFDRAEAHARRAMALDASAGPGLFMLGRLALWKHDRDLAAEAIRLFAELPRKTLPVASAQALAAALSFEPGAFASEPVQTLRSARAGSARFQAFLAQLSAEIAAALGHHEAAIEHAREAADAGTCDALWFDGCPLFASTRGDARFVAARTRVEARVAAARAVFELEAP